MKGSARLLTTSAALVAMVAPAASHAATPAPAQRPALSAAPARPVPDDVVRLAGRLGDSSRAVVLQRRKDGAWKPVTRGRSQQGRFQLTTRSTQPSTRYRVVATATSGRPRLVSRERVVKQATGPYLWSQHRTCRKEREGPEPISNEACDRVDAIFKRLGKVFLTRFHKAAQQGDVDRLREMSVEGRGIVEQFDGVEVTSLNGCFYFRTDGSEWFCRMHVASTPGEHIEVRAQIVRWEENEFPEYKVIAAERIAAG